MTNTNAHASSSTATGGGSAAADNQLIATRRIGPQDSVNFCTKHTPEVALIRYVLKNMEPEDFVGAILSNVESGALSIPNLELIQKALSVVGLPMDNALLAVRNTDDRHCLRCHETYKQCNNHLRACLVFHRGRILPNIVPSAYTANGTLTELIYECCGQPYSKSAGPHFLGKHTTNPNNPELVYNAYNVFTCAQSGCRARAHQAPVQPGGSN